MGNLKEEASMKKVLLMFLLVAVMFSCSACTKVAVILNSDLPNSEKYLDEVIALNNLNYIVKDSKNHVYSIGAEGLYSSLVNLVRDKSTTEGETTRRLDGHYSCYLKAVDKDNTLIKCSDTPSLSNSISLLTGLYFGQKGYGSYFDHLEYNGLEVVSLNKYQKLNKRQTKP